MMNDEEIKKDNLQELFEIIERNINKGSSLISRIGELINFSKENYPHENVDLKKIINNAVMNINAQFNDKNIKILIEFPEEEITIRGGNLLLNAFENIIKNAIIHNESEVKKIWIRASKTRNEDHYGVKLEFRDNGIGLDNDRKEKIFERIFIQDKSKRGMGIGLSLVKTIIEGYGGIIKVQDRISGTYTEGSNFILLLRQD